MPPARLLPGLALLLSAGAALAFLHGCQDTPEPTDPALAVTVIRKTLTVTGSGSGDGVVTSNPVGINCTVTAGVAAAAGCKASSTREGSSC